MTTEAEHTCLPAEPCPSVKALEAHRAKEHQWIREVLAGARFSQAEIDELLVPEPPAKIDP